MASENVLDILLSNDSIRRLISDGEHAYWQSLIDDSVVNKYGETSFSRLLYLLSFSYLQSDWKSSEECDCDPNLIYRLFQVYPVDDKDALCQLNSLCPIQSSDLSLVFYFIASAFSLRLGKTISARLILNDYQPMSSLDLDWRDQVITGVLRSLLYLIRKKGGFVDVNNAISEIEQLKKAQQKFESFYLNHFTEVDQVDRACELWALYHISKAVTEVAGYLLNGYSYPRRINVVIRKYMEQASSIMSCNPAMQDWIVIIHNVLKTLAENSIWNNTTFNAKIQSLCKLKAEQNLLELLPSQRNAMEQNLFDVSANSFILQMPTSAGKTLLAEFNILVTYAQLPDSKIVYVVPSRALVNQVYFDLRKDFEPLGLSVEKTSSAIEVDNNENAFLQNDDVNILVSTPEKIDLLLRRQHQAMNDVSLFVIDEAHTIANGQRGAKLELLVSLLHRERPNAKIMMLSPFFGGDNSALEEWLDCKKTIQVDWKPADKIIVEISRNRKVYSHEMLPSAHGISPYYEKHFGIQIDRYFQESSEREKLLHFVVEQHSRTNKSLLVLCGGRSSANKLAGDIYSWLATPSSIPEEVRLVQKFIEEEIGAETIYSRVLSRGVAIHHAGLSDEVKLLIEHLIREKYIRYVCATTTIAEGVNFPISSVFFYSYQKGDTNLSVDDFWNIAGRAGRTMIDKVGRIYLPREKEEDPNANKGRALVQQGAEQLVSVLASLMTHHSEISQLLNTPGGVYSLLMTYPDSFGPLFQYFVHLVRVADLSYADELEDIFRDTLGYYSLSPHQQQQFVSLCEQIYSNVRYEFGSMRGAMSFADKTGFSVPSVLTIMKARAKDSQIADLDSWQPTRLFDARNPKNLGAKIKVIAELRETDLGTDSKKNVFNPDKVAELLIAWVHGKSIKEMLNIHPTFACRDNTEFDRNISDLVNYFSSLRFKSSWGLSALEGIVRGEEEISDSYVPSYVYYGVKDEKALALRMIGVPRQMSTALSALLTEEVSHYSYSSLRNLVTHLSEDQWRSVNLRGSKLSKDEWKKIFQILVR